MIKQFNAPDGDSCKEVSYEYDALNFRTKRTSVLEETVTEYAYGRNGALTYEQFTKNGTVAGSRTYAYLNNQIVGFTDTVGTVESKRYAVTDIQGSVNEIYDESGNLIWKSGYTAFGELAGESVDKLEGVFEFHGMYTGCQIDGETGLTYHWNRWRSEDGSQFITQDPARDGSNWYVYCNNNSLIYVDPRGLSTTLDDFAYQKRTETSDYYEYITTFEKENIAASRNQGIKHKIFYTIKDNWIDKGLNNSYYHKKGIKMPTCEYTDYILNGDNQIIKELFKQKELEEKYNYDNFLCYVTDIINIYVTKRNVTKDFMNNQFEEIISNNLLSDNTLKDAGIFSEQIAKGLGLSKYWEYCYPGGAAKPLSLTENEFRNSKYEFGIGRYVIPGHNYNPNDRNDSIDHYELFRNKPYNDICNPGIGDAPGNYLLYDVLPIQNINFWR